VFHTFLGPHPNFFMEVMFFNFLIHLPLQTSSHHLIHIILKILYFPFLSMFSNLNLYILYHLNFHLLFPKKLEIKIFNKIIYLVSNFEIYKKNALNKSKIVHNMCCCFLCKKHLSLRWSPNNRCKFYPIIFFYLFKII